MWFSRLHKLINSTLVQDNGTGRLPKSEPPRKGLLLHVGVVRRAPRWIDIFCSFHKLGHLLKLASLLRTLERIRRQLQTQESNGVRISITKRPLTILFDENGLYHEFARRMGLEHALGGQELFQSDGAAGAGGRRRGLWLAAVVVVVGVTIIPSVATS